MRLFIPLALLALGLTGCVSDPFKYATTAQQYAFAARASYDAAETFAATAAEKASTNYTEATAAGKTSEAATYKAIVLGIAAAEHAAYPVAEAVRQTLLTYKPGDSAADAALQAQADALKSATVAINTASGKKDTTP